MHVMPTKYTIFLGKGALAASAPARGGPALCILTNTKTLKDPTQFKLKWRSGNPLSPPPLRMYVQHSHLLIKSQKY